MRNFRKVFFVSTFLMLNFYSNKNEVPPSTMSAESLKLNAFAFPLNTN